MVDVTRETRGPWSRHAPAKRQAILDAAATEFVGSGYDGTTVDTIAALAKVGKQTIYSHFGDKKQLFLAAIVHASRTGPAGRGLLAGIKPDDDPCRVLRIAARRYLAAVVDPACVALYRLTLAELASHPELREHARGPAFRATLAPVAEYLASADHRGLLSVPDPELSAHQFGMLLMAEGRSRVVGTTEELSRAEINAIAEVTTDLILRAHRRV